MPFQTACAKAQQTHRVWIYPVVSVFGAGRGGGETCSPNDRSGSRLKL